MTRAKTILFAGLVAGTLDAIAAILLFTNPVDLHHIIGMFRYIASPLFGRTQAFSGGPVYPVAGLAIHYLIALSWSSVYLLILSRSFKKGSVWIKTILFSSLVWVVMNGFVLPLCGLNPSFNDAWSIIKSFSPILFCIGLPICLIVEKKSASF